MDAKFLEDIRVKVTKDMYERINPTEEDEVTKHFYDSIIEISSTIARNMLIEYDAQKSNDSNNQND